MAAAVTIKTLRSARTGDTAVAQTDLYYAQVIH